MNDIELLEALSYTTGKLEGLIMAAGEEETWQQSAIDCLDELNRLTGFIKKRCMGEEAGIGTDRN